MSFQDEQLAKVGARGAANLAAAFEGYADLLDCPDDEICQAGALGLAEQVVSFSELLLRWHWAAGALLPAQSARLSGMAPEHRISAAEVARRLGVATRQQV